jgi:protein transport protein SEC20
MAKTANDITERLMSISRSLANEVQVGQQSVNNLGKVLVFVFCDTHATPWLLFFSVNSSHQVSETNEEFKNMSGHIQNSKRLLTKYGQRKSTNKLIIILAMVFFFATVLYIVKKRIFSSSVPIPQTTSTS